MANPHRGEVGVTIAGKPYTLVFTTNALCELEDALNRSAFAVFAEVAKATQDATVLRYSTLRAMLWAALRERHAGISLKEAGGMMEDFGIREVMGALVQAMAAAMPDPEQQDDAPKA